MTNKEFNTIIDNRINKIKNILILKGEEYANDVDRLHNFKRASKISEISPERVLDGFLLKHYTSYRDILDNMDNGIIPDQEYIDEKIGDIINYFILFEAIVSEKRSVVSESNQWP